ncbi:hypothetical protein KY290_008094 [Solanum tuberosum]|uniref:HAT C-terminal dimerisation domain-containing protein n=1 Tax=Solanum tuberosum TaxID=4113 RepID=A0ABQ7W9B0_SOLTU|nr:hypothetical protein KY290_008094 [Solanum tuberosum]
MFIDDHKYFKYCLDLGGKIEHPSSQDWRDANYLEDDVEKIKDFNILTWWKASSERYPIVSRIATDMLVIPTSVASKSAFSTGGCILDCYRSSSLPKTVEALVCSQQWLRSASTEYKIEVLLQEMQNLEIVKKESADATLSIE